MRARRRDRQSTSGATTSLPRRLLALAVGLDVVARLQMLVHDLALERAHRLQRDRRGGRGRRSPPPDRPRRAARPRVARGSRRRRPSTRLRLGRPGTRSGMRDAGSRRSSGRGGRSASPRSSPTNSAVHAVRILIDLDGRVDARPSATTRSSISRTRVRRLAHRQRSQRAISGARSASSSCAAAAAGAASAAGARADGAPPLRPSAQQSAESAATGTVGAVSAVFAEAAAVATRAVGGTTPAATAEPRHRHRLRRLAAGPPARAVA